MNRTRNGLRIPDQNLWTGELLDLPLFFDWDPIVEDIRLSYSDPTDDDWDHGLLWVRHGLNRAGKFRWKAINTPRTRVMMREHLCMVCSCSCQRPDGRYWWLFVNDPDIAPDGTSITNLPPTCGACIPESLATCPRLAERSRVVSVAGTSPYAATVDLYEPGPGDSLPVPAVKVCHEVNVLLDKGSEWLRYALGKQPWLMLHDLRDEALVLAEQQEAQP
ncbi:hypothetical protein GCM10023334_045160 [Nonomuraea thailandensis]